MLHSPARADRNRRLLYLQILQPPNCSGVRWCLQNPMQVTRPFLVAGVTWILSFHKRGSKLSKPKIYGKQLYIYNGFWFSILGDVKFTVEIFVELVVRFVWLLSPKILQPELYRKAVLILERWDFFNFQPWHFASSFSALPGSPDPGLHSLVLRSTALARSASGLSGRVVGPWDLEVKKKFDMRSWQKQKDIVCKRFFFEGDGCILDDDFKAFFCRKRFGWLPVERLEGLLFRP